MSKKKFFEKLAKKSEISREEAKSLYVFALENSLHHDPKAAKEAVKELSKTEQAPGDIAVEVVEAAVEQTEQPVRKSTKSKK